MIRIFPASGVSRSIVVKAHSVTAMRANGRRRALTSMVAHQRTTNAEVSSWHNVDLGNTNTCTDKKTVTMKQGSCQGGKGVAYCCDKDVDVSSCYWNTGATDLTHYQCSGSTQCSSTTSRIDVSVRGGPNGDGKGDKIHRCQVDTPIPGGGTYPSKEMDIAWCCDTKKLTGSVRHCATCYINILLTSIEHFEPTGAARVSIFSVTT
jgi:hypothetical protein